jgi:branched-chain amino acid transport system ATP-binding protein
MTEPLLRVENADVYYGPIRAVTGLNLEIAAGEKVALLGANGAGKTTTLRAISGMLAPKAGAIWFAGERIDGLPPHKVVGRGLAHLPDGRQLFPGLSVEENLRFGYYPRRRDKHGYRVTVERIMDFFPRLRERRMQAAGTLSGGEQQMLAVGRALMSSPRLLLVDELSLGLAPVIVEALFEILEEINREGTAVLIVEQFVHLALEHTDRAYVLRKGEVVASGPSNSLADDETLVESYLGVS